MQCAPELQPLALQADATVLLHAPAVQQRPDPPEEDTPKVCTQFSGVSSKEMGLLQCPGGELTRDLLRVVKDIPPQKVTFSFIMTGGLEIIAQL